MEELNQILAELETNLRDLESARTQVNHITSASDEVNNSTRELIEKVEQFINLTTNNTFDFTNEFSATLSNYKNEIGNFLESTRAKTEEDRKKIIEITSTFIKAINDNFDDFNEKSNKTFDVFDDKLNNVNKSFENTTKTQTENINKAITKLDNLIVKQATEFNDLKQEFKDDIKKQNKINVYFFIAIIILLLTNLILQFIK